MLKPTDKILIIAPHPDDEVIACGGLMLKYHDQIDVLCVNSSGVKYKTDTLSAEELAQIRCDDFVEVMKKAGIKKYHITKIWGIPPMINQIKKHFNEYSANFKFKEYDYIFVPHSQDNHVEHRYVGNKLLKKLLLKSGFKHNLKIVRYELWSPMPNPNYYEDITEYTKQKTDLINTYSSRNSHYAERILGLNKYRTLASFFENYEKYAEAYYVESIYDYLINTTLGKIVSLTTEIRNGIERKTVNIAGLKIKIKMR